MTEEDKLIDLMAQIIAEHCIEEAEKQLNPQYHERTLSTTGIYDMDNKARKRRKNKRESKNSADMEAS